MEKELRCPHCGSSNIVGYEGNFECFSCGYQWSNGSSSKVEGQKSLLEDLKEPKKLEIICLDVLDGFQFQILCKRILERLGWGKVVKVGYVADEGQDLLIRSASGDLTVVECKHHLNGHIGSPVVQKLHSAVITCGAKRGVIITTGRFTKKAVNLARRISKQTPIILIDLPKLADMALKVGIKITTKYASSVSLYTYRVFSPIELRERVLQLFEEILSFPHDVSDLLSLIPLRLLLHPVYLIKYDIHEDFRTSTGRLIYAIHEDGQLLVIDAISGKVIDRDVSFFLKQGELLEYSAAPKLNYKVFRKDFKVDITTVMDIAAESIIKRHTKRVTYTGRNNRWYVKICRPSKSRIHLRDIKLVLLPILYLTIRILRKNYKIIALENGELIKVVSSDFNRCRICSNPMEEKGLLCNSCGNIVHKPSFTKKCGFVCQRCGKTICKECAYKLRRFLLFKSIICEDCAKELVMEGRKVKPLSEQ